MPHEVQDPRLLASECELELSVEQRGCFSERTITLHLAWTEQEASLLVNQRAQGCSRAQLLSLAEQIVLAAERPEVSLGGRSTTGYYAALRWRFRASSSGEWSSGEAKFASHDLPASELQSLFRQRPELAARIPPHAYARAIGLHELALLISKGTSFDTPVT